jgi:hypothetical protein
MMVLLRGGVEGSAKIAMTPLLNGQRRWVYCRMTSSRGSFFPALNSREFVNLKLGSGTRREDICELTNSMQKAERELRRHRTFTRRANPRWQCQVSKLDREKVIDCDQDNQQHDAEAEAPADQLFLDRQQRLDRSRSKLILEVGLRHQVSFGISF